MTLTEALILSAVGIVLILVVLTVLMFVIKLMSLIVNGKGKQEKPQEEKPHLLAEGSCGSLIMENVTERQSAMIMAIVADELKTPLCELRFKSIREVKGEDK